MPDAGLVEIIIQGGAIGLMLVFGYGIYKIVRRVIDAAVEFATNHMSHLTSTLEEVNATLIRLDSTIQGCPARKKDAS